MKPPLFDYYAPTTLDEALDMRSTLSDDSVILAGGQSLMPLLNMRMAMPAAVIDLGRVEGLSGIRAWDGGVAIGAMTRQRDAERSEVVGASCPLLLQGLRHVGHPAIRNRGTVGGSIAHADGAAELPTVALALNGTLVARSVRGERTIAAEDFFLGFLTTALEPDELLVEVRLPWLPGRAGSSFVEIARRHGDFAVVGVAAAVVLGADDLVEAARLVFMGIGGAPVRAHAAESMLKGARADEATFAAAAGHAAVGLEPQGDIHASADYRRRVAGVVARRALVAAHAHALSNGAEREAGA